ncbi:MAG: DUF4270 family protein [Chitinophagaceae bacterium]|nr:DUF4270 family protein [Chitinophagaceae bacterium]
MKNRQLALAFVSVISGIVLLLSSCKKINESSEIGGGLIPPIDNINTFDTTLTVEAYNGIFDFNGPNPLLNDSTRTNVTDEQWLGLITNDPFFGKTDARMFLELKPAFYRHTFLNKADSIFIDSIVLVLDYVETYGDSSVPQTFNVYELDPSTVFEADTAYLIRQNSFTYSNLLGSATITPSSLNDSVKAFRDTTKNQLRITLNNTFGRRLLDYDTISSGPNNAYSNDSTFRSKFKGFAIQSVSGGNAIMGFNLGGANTKLAIYYNYYHGLGTSDKDTTVTYFTFAGNANSAAANYIQRDYSGTPVLAAQGGASPDPFVYIQTTPGTFATIKIPALAGLSNRVVHRAELIAEQAYHISDSTFPPPTYLYVDAYDPSLSKYLMIPYDLAFDGSGSLNLGSFGIAPINAVDGAGNVVRTWRFNLSRYVQHVVNDTEPLYDLRLFAPLYTLDQYRPTPASTATTQLVSINPAVAKGRVRLHGNTDPLDPNPRKMRLRIIYSKL